MQRQRDEASGLLVSDRYFLPQGEKKAHPIRWSLMNTLVLGCLVLGIFRLLITGFGIPVSDWFFPAAAGICLLAAVLCQSQWAGDHWGVLAVPLFLIYASVLFVYQTEFLTGMAQLVNLSVYQLNAVYSGSLERIYAAVGINQIQVFLIFITPILVLWLSIAVLRKGIPLMMEMLVFPAAAALLLFQAGNDRLGQGMLLVGVVLSLAYCRVKRQRRMWGGENEPLVRQNRRRFEEVQKRSALAVLCLCMALALPGYLLLRPLVGTLLMPARQYATQLQTTALNRVLKLLPEITAGRYNLNVEAVGGGVQDGSLSADTGYLLEGVEDMRLTLTAKPEESLFLRGYVGATYQDGAWKEAPGYTFDGAAMNWKTDGSPRLFIQNLPFLRTAFALNQTERELPDIAGVAPMQLFVERINANAAYTYVPYGAYLNDYYRIEAGDGVVSGQHDQEDRYFFFGRSDMERVLSAWNDLGDTANVLDRVEESYRAFCTSQCVAVPEGLEALQAEVDAVKAENRWLPMRDNEDITQWIRHYMVENFSYQLFTDPVPENEDALLYFLFTTRKGNSIHFASAAVVLYRMFGVPARYVVGYEVLPTLFSVQAGGLYTAIVQGDNSQAWAEIYMPGLGWMPQDMTPGVIGTLEEVGVGGIPLEAPVDFATLTDLDAPPMTDDDVPALDTPDDPGVSDEPEQGTPIDWRQVLLIAVTAAGGLVLFTLLSLWFRRINRALGLIGPADRRKLLGIFQAVYRRARRLKLPDDVDSQQEAFVDFITEQLRMRRATAADEAAAAVDGLYRCIYRGVPVLPEDVRRMRRVLKGLYRRRKR